MDLDTYHYSYSCPAHSNAYRACTIGLMGEEGLYYYGYMYLLPGQTGNGTISLTARGKPSLSFPSYISVLPNNYYMYRFTVSDIFSYYNLEPSSESFYIRPETHIVYGKFAEEGEYNYTLTVGNQYGNSTVHFTMGVNRCPGNQYFIGFSRLDNYREKENFLVYTPSNELLFTTLNHSAAITGAGMCVNGKGNVLVKMIGPEEGWNQRLPIRFFDKLGVLGEFQLERQRSENARHFYYEQAVSAGSAIRYSHRASESWTNSKFKDNDWTEGHSGAWGSYQNDKVYFRKSFEVRDLEDYSLLFVDLTHQDPAVVYLNGNKLTSAIPRNTTQRFVFPVSLLEKKNVIAVELTQNTSSTILFDVVIHLATTQTYQLSTDGTPKDSQVYPDQGYHVENAFDNDDTKAWRIKEFPTTLEYAFPPSHERIVNQVMMRQSVGNTPTSLRIEAVTSDNNTVVLYQHVNSTIFMTVRDYEVIRFENTQSYNTYRIVFEEAAKNRTNMEMRDIRFMYYTPFVCKKKLGVNGRNVEDVTFKSCPFTRMGVREMKCLNVDNRATWVDDQSACHPKYPKKPMSYIDFSMIVNNVYYELFDTVKGKVIELITKKLTVHEEEISFIHLRDLSTSNQVRTELHIRFTVETLIGDYIIYHFGLLLPTWNELITEFLGDEYSGSILEEPILHNPIKWGWIVLSSLVITAVVAYLAFYFVVRSKSSGYSLKRALNKNKGENRALLDPEV